MRKYVYVGIEYQTELPSVEVKHVFSNEPTAEIWADQSEVRDYERHALESKLGRR
jgi:hypothetical protein